MEMEQLSNGAIRFYVSKKDFADRNLELKDILCANDKSMELFLELFRMAHERYNFTPDDGLHCTIDSSLSPDGAVLTLSNSAKDYSDDWDDSFGANTSFPDNFDFEDIRESVSDDGNSMNSRQMRDQMARLHAWFRVLGSAAAESDAPIKSEPPRNAQPFGSLEETRKAVSTEAPVRTVAYCFRKLDNLTALARVLKPFRLDSSLYYDSAERIYVLQFDAIEGYEDDFDVARSLADEFGTLETTSPGYYHEYFRRIAADHALEQLATL